MCAKNKLKCQPLLRWSPSLTWSSQIKLGWLASGPQGSSYLPLIRARIISRCHHAWFFTWALGTELRSLSFCFFNDQLTTVPHTIKLLWKHFTGLIMYQLTTALVGQLILLNWDLPIVHTVLTLVIYLWKSSTLLISSWLLRVDSLIYV